MMFPLWYIYFAYKEYLKPRVRTDDKGGKTANSQTPKTEVKTPETPKPVLPKTATPEPSKPSTPIPVPKTAIPEPPKPKTVAPAPVRPEPPKTVIPEAPKPTATTPLRPEPSKSSPLKPLPSTPDSPNSSFSASPKPSTPDSPKVPFPPKPVEPSQPAKPLAPESPRPGAPEPRYEPNVLEGPQIPAWRVQAQQKRAQQTPGNTMQPMQLERSPSPYSEEDIISGIEEDSEEEDEVTPMDRRKNARPRQPSIKRHPSPPVSAKTRTTPEEEAPQRP